MYNVVSAQTVILRKVDGMFQDRATDSGYFILGVVMLQKERKRIVTFLTTEATRGAMLGCDCGCNLHQCNFAQNNDMSTSWISQPSDPSRADLWKVTLETALVSK